MSLINSRVKARVAAVDSQRTDENPVFAWSYSPVLTIWINDFSICDLVKHLRSAGCTLSELIEGKDVEQQPRAIAQGHRLRRVSRQVARTRRLELQQTDSLAEDRALLKCTLRVIRSRSWKWSDTRSKACVTHFSSNFATMQKPTTRMTKILPHEASIVRYFRTSTFPFTVEPGQE